MISIAPHLQSLYFPSREQEQDEHVLVPGRETLLLGGGGGCLGHVLVAWQMVVTGRRAEICIPKDRKESQSRPWTWSNPRSLGTLNKIRKADSCPIWKGQRNHELAYLQTVSVKTPLISLTSVMEFEHDDDQRADRTGLFGSRISEEPSVWQTPAFTLP